MMRILENGIKVKMIPISEKTYAVDNKQDLDHVESEMEK